MHDTKFKISQYVDDTTLLVFEDLNSVLNIKSAIL